LELLILALVGLGASFVKSAFGLGAGVLFGPVLALFLEPRLAMGMTAPIMFLSSVAALGAHWRRWDWPLLRRLLPTALFGLALGSYFLAWTPATSVRRAIGLAALAFAAAQTVRLQRQDGEAPDPPDGPVRAARERPALQQAAVAALLGFGGGIVSGIAHSGGLFFSMYLLPRLGKAAFVASLTLTLFVVDTFRLVSYWYLDVLESRHLALSLPCLPLMLLGGRLGKALGGRLSDRGFARALILMIAGTGVALLVR